VKLLPVAAVVVVTLLVLATSGPDCHFSTHLIGRIYCSDEDGRAVAGPRYPASDSDAT
jgi:hypothetical protein